MPVPSLGLHATAVEVDQEVVAHIAVPTDVEWEMSVLAKFTPYTVTRLPPLTGPFADTLVEE